MLARLRPPKPPKCKPRRHERTFGYDLRWKQQAKMMLSKSHCQIEHTILGGGFTYFLFFIPIWGRFLFWLIFFRWVETTNQNTSSYILKRVQFKCNVGFPEGNYQLSAHPSWFFAALLKMLTFDTFAKELFLGLISCRLNLWWKQAPSSHGCEIRNTKLAIHHDMVKWHWFSQWWKWIAVCPLHITKNCLTFLGIWVAHPTNPCELMSRSRSLNWKLRPVRWRDIKTNSILMYFVY